jgi:cytochrome oxidase Cu insertion factor (SCO1/SenC/PrrC family)
MPMTSAKLRAPALSAVLALLAPTSVGAQRPALGPADGAHLPPLDTGRVAVGTVAPDFTLETKDGGIVTLSQFRGNKTVVLVFYRGHW